MKKAAKLFRIGEFANVGEAPLVIPWVKHEANKLNINPDNKDEILGFIDLFILDLIGAAKIIRSMPEDEFKQIPWR
ncbi:hypothetical protein COV24_00255 [candidate division WWE3 bacterium CG10_big_fil_rev_8_21_14_0_10_32_10]|uniref:Uncharacterized protein n=1 Tax=candidate division WWE3 bacterium CG10_big_fil_rev_8_21_14_0_10_32_10 TaxID=1975090 RepID=A0A2H0RDL7_UNCKA|nr:MAG: hypothetical protein COV24_00255 [candidate division WWE3 bacterium CG10_big_fil_rev_8_21_14_0_10_32_10]